MLSEDVGDHRERGKRTSRGSAGPEPRGRGRAGTDEGNAAERVERKRRRKKALLLEELRNSLGLVSSACDKVGVGRTTFYEWLKNDPEFARQVDEIEERALDFVESKMFQAIQNGDVRLIQFYLSTKGRKRGYAPKTDVETGPVVLQISQEEADF
ncbi:MAG: hypothetical protein IJO46_00420 [Thermoguttaceae bacterium]|nr:hypothetical protein [Thermoguttaceae bacterium]MBQ7110527.1 hypothetical protein [Thermoguttaceae bacterium]